MPYKITPDFLRKQSYSELAIVSELICEELHQLSQRLVTETTKINLLAKRNRVNLINNLYQETNKIKAEMLYKTQLLTLIFTLMER